MLNTNHKYLECPNDCLNLNKAFFEFLDLDKLPRTTNR
jgi:hypothetical protein